VDNELIYERELIIAPLANRSLRLAVGNTAVEVSADGVTVDVILPSVGAARGKIYSVVAAIANGGAVRIFGYGANAGKLLQTSAHWLAYSDGRYWCFWACAGDAMVPGDLGEYDEYDPNDPYTEEHYR
jgi:hypothetical protein